MWDRKQVITIVCNKITDADEACRSSEISVNLIIIILFLQTYSYFCYILHVFIYIYIYMQITEHRMVCDDKWHSFVRVLFFILDEVFSVQGVTTMRASTIVLTKQVVLTEKTSSNIKKRTRTTECHLSSHTIILGSVIIQHRS